ncbi:MAG: MFS transporter [Chloroflexota bacterium]|nr:MFS transporter [Chloroflexota bacterium]
MHRLFKREPIYYGWYIALALAITETVSFGVIFYAFSVFITPMEAELGWSRAEISGGFSLMWLITGIFAFPVGYWLDKHGSRLLMTLGSIGATVMVLLWSRVTTLPEFILVMGLLGFCGAAVLYEPAFIVIANWFVNKRGRAMAFLTFIAGFASTIFVPLADALLVAHGWRGAVFILGVLLGVITIPLHALVLRSRPTDLGLQPDGEARPAEQGERESIKLDAVFRSRFFWILTLAFALSALCIAALRVHFVPLLISMDIHPSSAAIASGAIGVMQVTGRVIFAAVEWRFSSKTMAIGVFILLALSLVTLLLGSSPLLIILFIALFGMAVGANTLIRPLIVADTYGAAFYGRISSAMVFFLTLAGTSAPFAAGVIYDLFNSYSPMLIVVTGFSLVSILLIALLPARSEINAPASH